MNAAVLLLLATAFAYPNEQGTRLLATAEIAKPEALRIALCSGGQQLPVQFERRQPEGADSTGRQTPRNFANTAGTVFRITGGTVGADTTCMLADESFLDGATVLPLKRPADDARCPKARYPDFQVDKGRPVVGCWPIAESSTGARIAVIEFARRLTDALASLVVVDGDRRIYVDYPARFKGPGDDLWRVEDGGQIHADGFDVVFLLKRGATYLLAVDWAAAEGSALSLHISEGGGPFKEVISDSWYRAPV
jgi:hypothetical protein